MCVKCVALAGILNMIFASLTARGGPMDAGLDFKGWKRLLATTFERFLWDDCLGAFAQILWGLL